jgi:membrane fusion protein (multidrug efflux system)
MLARGGVVPRAQLDQAEPRSPQPTDLAALDAQLVRKVVRAPFAGRLGIRAVNVGQFLQPGTTVTTVDAIGTPFVDFSVPQEELPSLSVGQPVRVNVAGAKQPVPGTIYASEPTVDPTSGTKPPRARPGPACSRRSGRPGWRADDRRQ